MTADFRWGVVGLGNVVGTRFAPAVVATPGARLVACSSRDAQKGAAFAARFAVARVHPTFDAMLADAEVDAVYIATPNSLHAEQAIAALRAGKHVLCEKPLALSQADGTRVVEAAKAVGRLLGIAFQFRFEAVFARARAIVRSGALGDLRTVSLLGSSPASTVGAWRQTPEEGGILSDLAVHLFDLLPWMTGLDYARIGACASPPDIDREPMQTISVLAALGARCHAFVQASREVASGQQSLLVEGTRGMLWCPAWRGAAQVTLTTRDASGEVTETITGAPAFNGVVAAFAAAARGQETSLATGADGLRNIVLADAVRRAAREGATIALAEVA